MAYLVVYRVGSILVVVLVVVVLVVAHALMVFVVLVVGLVLDVALISVWSSPGHRMVVPHPCPYPLLQNRWGLSGRYDDHRWWSSGWRKGSATSVGSTLSRVLGSRLLCRGTGWFGGGMTYT